MTLKAFAVYDKVAAIYAAPMFAVSEQSMVDNMVAFAKSNLVKNWAEHPQDFVLYEFGEYDQLLCQLKVLPLRPVCELSWIFKKARGEQQDSYQLDLEEIANG